MNSQRDVPFACVAVRPVVKEDEQMIFDWRNLPWVVALGATKAQVTRGGHGDWFDETLRRDRRRLFVVEVQGAAAGMIRYDSLETSSVEISMFLLPGFAGRGIGSAALNRSLPALISWRPVSKIVARVLSENTASRRFFERMNFILDERQPAEGIALFTRKLTEISHSRPDVGKAEADAAASVVLSGHIGQGKKTHVLERDWSAAAAAPHSVCVGSGLGALRLALFALGAGKGDEVILPAYSCVALLNAVLAVNAVPVLADVVPDRWTISAEDARRHLSDKTKAIVAVHLFGAPADIEALESLGVPVIEDCAHGIGGSAGRRPFGGAGTVSISSFYATKMLAAGEGGIVASGDAALIEKVRRARDYGDQLPSRHHLNDKMSDIEAAIVIEQLKRLPEFLTARAQRAAYYHALLAPLAERGLVVLPGDFEGRIWYRYAIRLVRHSAAQVCNLVSGLNVKMEQPVWDLRECDQWHSKLDGSSMALDHVISLPLYPQIDRNDMQQSCAALEYILDGGQ